MCLICTLSILCEVHLNLIQQLIVLTLIRISFTKFSLFDLTQNKTNQLFIKPFILFIIVIYFVGSVALQYSDTDKKLKPKLIIGDLKEKFQQFNTHITNTETFKLWTNLQCF